MKLTGGAIVTRALEDEGIELAFGIPGTHNIELYDALAESERVRTVLVTDEQSASFMADGAWRASGQLACVNVVPGAGLTHALSGIAEAFLDNVPMLVLGCGVRRDQPRAFQLHDVDQMAIVRPVVKEAFLVESGERLYDTVRRACAVARTGAPGPVFVEVPVEHYLFRHEAQLPPPGGPGGAAPAQPVDETAVRRVAELIRNAKRPLLYVGAGTAGATDHLLRLAELLDAPVSTTFQGKGVFPEEHPLFLWPGFGATAPPFVRKVADRCDLTVAIGCRFSEVGTGSYALEPKGPLIHVDVDPSVFDRNFAAEVAVVADAQAFFAALWEVLDATPRVVDEKVRAEIREGHAGVWESWLGDVGGELVSPAHLLRSAQHV
ncbi:MAG TPA: thiamine pyrophosphate-binding protein, partial [Longimicrobiales bacterium]|nr:thiamine pyrophosphate-binding protein [Longimicrobiales bacterium]